MENFIYHKHTLDNIVFVIKPLDKQVSSGVIFIIILANASSRERDAQRIWVSARVRFVNFTELWVATCT